MAKKNVKETNGNKEIIVSVNTDPTQPQNDFVVPVQDSPSTSEEDKARDMEDSLDYNEETLSQGDVNAYQTVNPKELKTVTGRIETNNGTIYVGVKRD